MRQQGYFRAVNENDLDLLFEWANDTAVRQNSFSMERISYEEHQIWFKELLKKGNSKQYIYMYQEQPIGQARVLIEKNVAEIGYSICKEKRGMGHGQQMLYLLAEQVKKDFPQVERVVGKVKPENIASQKTFLAAGYREKYYLYEMNINNEIHK